MDVNKACAFYSSLPRRVQVCLDTLRLARAFPYVRAGLGGDHTVPLCPHCQHADSADHRIVHCPHYDSFRAVMVAGYKAVYGGDLPGGEDFSLDLVLMYEKCYSAVRKYFVPFLVQSGLIHDLVPISLLPTLSC